MPLDVFGDADFQTNATGQLQLVGAKVLVLNIQAMDSLVNSRCLSAVLIRRPCANGLQGCRRCMLRTSGPGR